MPCQGSATFYLKQSETKHSFAQICLMPNLLICNGIFPFTLQADKLFNENSGRTRIYKAKLLRGSMLFQSAPVVTESIIAWNNYQLIQRVSTLLFNTDENDFFRSFARSPCIKCNFVKLF